MCGIAGVFHYAGGGRADVDTVRRMNDAMFHRGPDDAGVHDDGAIALGHRRLSVIDLSVAGHQPMSNADESLWVTYNGELYGWPEQRDRLRRRGHSFRGTSDTEALLHLYEEHGDGLLEHLRGMFAFGLFDRRRRRLLLARDRTGIKPIYYHDAGRGMVFAYVLMALLHDPGVARTVDPAAVADYLTFRYVPAPRTALNGVRKLPAGHYLTSDADGVRVRRYWRLPVAEAGVDDGPDHYREGLRELLEDAVDSHLAADVPLGAFLSGGIDSSAVVALMSRVSAQPVRTCSVGFEEGGVSELAHARRVAEHLGTEHTELVVRPRAMDLLPRLVRQLDEPFAAPSAIPTFCVAEAARRDVTVALSGDGGDEAFAGYTTYAFARDYQRFDAFPRFLRRAAALPSGRLPFEHSLGRRLRRVGMDPVERHLEVMALFRRAELALLLSPQWRAELSAHDPTRLARDRFGHARPGGDLAALLHLDAETYMVDDVLTKVDRTSMLVSLEVRVPLLDHRVQEFAARIPFRYKLRGDVTKWVLRESVRDLLPADILARGKQGFGVPVEHWLGADFEALSRAVLLDGSVGRRGWFDPAAVRTLVAGGAGVATGRDRANRLWALVCLELWAQTFLDGSTRGSAATGPGCSATVLPRTGVGQR